jgi:hypothetical protein
LTAERASPLPEKGVYSDWEQAAEVAQVWEAELMALRLRENGLPARVLDQSFRQEPLTSLRSFSVVRVLVPRGQGELARAILARTGDAALLEHFSDAPELGDGHEEQEP